MQQRWLEFSLKRMRRSFDKAILEKGIVLVDPGVQIEPGGTRAYVPWREENRGAARILDQLLLNELEYLKKKGVEGPLGLLAHKSIELMYGECKNNNDVFVLVSTCESAEFARQFKEKDRSDGEALRACLKDRGLIRVKLKNEKDRLSR